MKIAVDTNVLVRYLTWDDEDQAEEATRTIESAETIAIPIVVLCELVWVLQRGYRYTNDEIVKAVRHLTESRTAEVDRPATEAGLEMLARGGDFADGVIVYEASRLKCGQIVTFDQTLAGLAGSANIALLGAGRPA